MAKRLFHNPWRVLGAFWGRGRALAAMPCEVLFPALPEAAFAPASARRAWRIPQLPLVITLNVALIAFNIMFADLTPPVTSDEVMFTDPAVNLAWGHGFRTSAWYTQPYDTIFAGNAPLYSLLLSGWIRLLGFDITIVRSFNYLIMALTITVLCFNLRQATCMRDRNALTLFILLLWLGEGIALSYRMGRYDALGILMLALLWTALLIRRKPLRYGALFLLGAAIPVTGYHLVIYVMLSGVVLLIVRPDGALRDFVAVAGGIAAGITSIFATYYHLGALDQLTGSLMHHSHAASLRGLPLDSLVHALRLDLSSLCLLGALALLTLHRMRSQPLGACRIELIGLFYLLVVLTAYGTMRMAQDYYAWMKYIPAAVCVVISLYELNRAAPRPRLCLAAFALAIVATFGFPARLTLAARDAEGFRHNRLAQFVENQIRPDDWALISYEAYYPAKRTVERLFLTGYRDFLTPEEKARLSVLICNTEHEDSLLAAAGGEWICTARYDPMGLFEGGAKRSIGWPPYQLSVFRRATESASELAQAGLVTPRYQ